MPEGDKVHLLEFWASPFSGRVKVALEEKGVQYVDSEEDLFGCKSELLLNANPIHQKVPVWLHNDKPVLESANIVCYMDELWLSKPLLPTCAYDRAQARFWTYFIDKRRFGGFKVEDNCPKLSAWTKRCLKRQYVYKALPDPERIYQLVVHMRKMEGLD